jgi:N-methylhydantoinase B/oxoprolinase/acetone carboxylase alpha subunit
VVVFDVNGDETYRESVELAGASGNRVTRKVLSEVPDTAARVRAIVADQTDELRLEGYEAPVQLSIKYNADQQLAIVDFA